MKKHQRHKYKLGVLRSVFDPSPARDGFAPLALQLSSQHRDLDSAPTALLLI